MDDVRGSTPIAADQGNAAQMMGQNTNRVHTAHTSNRTSPIDSGRPAVMLPRGGMLSAVAPTVPAMMSIAQPPAVIAHDLPRSRPQAGHGVMPA